ncbi:MAG: endopeptidase La, partial [Anaerotignum sp.]|nr:endopeptidase La [Anaerotignum sp.]
YYLREELKVIQDELGDKDGVGADAAKYRKQLEEKNPPANVKETVEKEIDRMLKIPVTSPESNVSRTYIETMLSLPWTERTDEAFDLNKAAEILDEDHYGMKKVKERVLEYLAVRKNAPEENATILCLVGPPGVGKTSIARSIAKAVNRKYVRMSLGGVKDEAEIRGHRRTYIGAMPGRIINAMKQAGTVNPLILFDEVDKLGVSHNGDPAAALLEVLDPEQNSTFRDHFVEQPYDLSKVLFMCTANSLETIPGPLRDRMEIIELSSYTANEKLHIAENHLVGKQRKRHGLTAKQLKFKTDAIDAIIDGYTREAGVRQLERVIGEVCRKAVTMILSGEKKSMTVSVKTLEDLLGARKFMPETIYSKPQVGIVRGLAWTSVGGTTLSVEVNVMPGEGKFKVTGNLGKVMQESSEAAISFIRSRYEEFKLESDFYKTNDIHIHIPEGATPKDGPSAGVTMATAMISALTGTPVRNDVAMTGEVTIRGRVLAIGGLQEKVLAAKKVGIKTVVLPKENEKDLNEILPEIREGMEFVLAETMDDVLGAALVKGEKA